MTKTFAGKNLQATKPILLLYSPNTRYEAGVWRSSIPVPAAARPVLGRRVWQWVAGRTAAILTPILTTGKRVVMRMKVAIDDHNTDFGL
jgi:hypothetical protein